MPVAKLSRAFYEKFGDKLTDELVTCLNSIETSYRSEIKDLFEAHFARLEERLVHGLGETRSGLRAEFKEEIGRLRVEIHAARAEVIKWMFVFWVPVVMALIGLYLKS
jgi:hypothetical protein